jgi:hypothetical protein
MAGLTYITDRRAINFSNRQGEPIKHIVLHGTESGLLCDEECSVRYLVDNERAVSSHELVVGTNVYLMVDLIYAAHTVGFSRLPDGARGWLANARTYNREGYKNVGLPMDPLTKSSMVKRAALVAKELGWTPEQVVSTDKILFHRVIDTQGKTCPGLDWNLQEVRLQVADEMDGDDQEVAEKFCWVIESGADLMRREGRIRVVDALLNSPDYIEWKFKRDN